MVEEFASRGHEICTGGPINLPVCVGQCADVQSEDIMDVGVCIVVQVVVQAVKEQPAVDELFGEGQTELPFTARLALDQLDIEIVRE